MWSERGSRGRCRLRLRKAKLNPGVRFALSDSNVTDKGLGNFLFFLGMDKLSGVLKLYADNLSAFSVHVVKPASMPKVNAYKEDSLPEALSNGMPDVDSTQQPVAMCT